MNPHPDYTIDPEQLRKQGAACLEFLARHFQSLETIPIKPELRPGQLAERFGPRAPEQPREFGDLIQDLESKILPGVTHWQHPKFFAYYPAASSLPAILSELVVAALGSVGLQWSANPIGTELECVVMDWIARMIQVPDHSPFLHSSGKGGGLIQNTAGDALVAIMVAARVRQHLRRMGQTAPDAIPAEAREEAYSSDSSKLVAYMSDHTHFSGPKAARVAGLRLRLLPAQKLAHGNYGITGQQVKAAMDEDRSKGFVPCYLQLNFGSTNTCGSDDMESFLGFADREEVWLHVDAAYAGASLILPRFKARARAIHDIADSFNFNGSKWFLCGFDSAFLFVRDRRWLKDVFSASGDYLATVQAEDIYNPEFKDWAVPLGRRFRSLRIWMVLEYFGVHGLQDFLEAAIAQGDWLRKAIDDSKEFVQVATTDLGLVCFKCKDGTPSQHQELVHYLQSKQASGGPFLVYPSQLQGEPMLRVALGGANTDLRHVEEFWSACQQWSQSH